MTEKRFKLGYVCGDWGLIDNGVWIDLHSMSENSEKNVQICINKMNTLADENERLKQDKQHSHQAMSRQEVRHKQFRDEVFDLIDAKIKEADEGFEQTSDSWYNGQIDALKELKKELEE